MRIKEFIKKISIFVVFTFLTCCLFSCAKPGDATISKAMQAYQKKDYETSLNLFIQALNEKKNGIKDSNYSQELICGFISNIYMEIGEFESANIYLEELLEEKPDYRMFVQLGRNYREIGDNANAEKSYLKAIELNQEKGEAWASLGALKIAEEKYSEAVECLTQAAIFDSKIAVIHANLAVALALSGDKDAAEEEFKKAKELKCENLDDFRDRAGM